MPTWMLENWLSLRTVSSLFAAEVQCAGRLPSKLRIVSTWSLMVEGARRLSHDQRVGNHVVGTQPDGVAKDTDRAAVAGDGATVGVVGECLLNSRVAAVGQIDVRASQVSGGGELHRGAAGNRDVAREGIPQSQETNVPVPVCEIPPVPSTAALMVTSPAPVT